VSSPTRRDAPSLEEVLEHVRLFYERNCPPRRASSDWGVGDDSVVGSVFAADAKDDSGILAARKFQASLFDEGFAWLRGPPELGGCGFDRDGARAIAEIASRFEAPDTSCFYVGQHIVSPALVVYGTAAQRTRWLTALWRGDAIGCQLFSEPDAGSDLASVRTSAHRVTGGWSISGQKVWSSGAHLSDVGELLARTDPDRSLRHRGLTMFLLDMTSPGVTVRPLRQMTGNAHFCEVFFEDVFVPEADVLGEVGQGWSVALTSLNSERDGFEGIGEDLFLDPLGRFIQLVAARGAGADLKFRDAAVRSLVEGRLVELLAARIDQAPTPALEAVGSSMVKLAATSANFALVQRVASVLGSSVIADSGAWGTFCWSRMLLGVFAPRIAGGTDEIQRNLIAERGLGLPREAKP